MYSPPGDKKLSGTDREGSYILFTYLILLEGQEPSVKQPTIDQ